MPLAAIIPPRLHRHLAALALVLAGTTAQAADPSALEQALAAAQQERRGVTLYVNGQTIGGAVTRVEPGQWVELRSQASSRIVVRLERIDAVALP